MCLFQVKKLVYVYLVRYAEEQQDLALLSISTFQRGLKVCAHKQHFIIFKTYSMHYGCIEMCASRQLCNGVPMQPMQTSF